MAEKKMTMGVIVGNRGFFPDQLAKTGREEMMHAVEKAGMDCVVLGPRTASTARSKPTKRRNDVPRSSKRIAIVSTASSCRFQTSAMSEPLPIRCGLARLDVPVLVQATPDIPGQMTIASRRDSFCGKMSACNNLRQYGIPYSLTTSAHRPTGLGRFPEQIWRGLRRSAGS